MFLKCYLLHKDTVLPRLAIFYVFVSMSTSRSIYVLLSLTEARYILFTCLVSTSDQFMSGLSDIFSIFHEINHIISFEENNLFFGHLYLKLTASGCCFAFT